MRQTRPCSSSSKVLRQWPSRASGPGIRCVKSCETEHSKFRWWWWRWYIYIHIICIYIFFKFIYMYIYIYILVLFLFVCCCRLIHNNYDNNYVIPSCIVLYCHVFLFYFGMVKGNHLDLILTSCMGFEHHPLRTKKLIASPMAHWGRFHRADLQGTQEHRGRWPTASSSGRFTTPEICTMICWCNGATVM